MSTNDLKRFIFGVPDKSVDNFNQKITGSPTLDPSTHNVSSGIKRGLGVRYASAPLGGHNNTETPASNQTNGIQRSEITSGSNGLTYRERIYGIVPITMAPYDGSYPKPNRQYYCFLVGLDYSTDVSLDACLGSTLESGVYKQASTLVAGLQASSYRQESPLIRLHKTELLNLPQTSTPVAADMQAILKGISDKYYIPYAQISVAGKRVPYQWMFGAASNSPSATKAPSIQLWQKTLSVGTNPTVLGGSPSEVITREFTDNDQRLLSVYCLDDDGYVLDIQYTKQITQIHTQASSAYDTATNEYMNLTGATKTGAATNYTDITAALINDPGSYTNTRHDAVLVAGECPIAIVYQDWLKATTGMLPRFVDLTNPGCNLRSINIYQGDDQIGLPSVSPNPDQGISIKSMVSDTGFLRIDIPYDIGVSYYNKILDYETNVGFISSIQTGGIDTKDNYAVLLEADEMFPPNIDNAWEHMITTQRNTLAWEASNTSPVSGVETGRGFHINDYEARFYYRQSGIGEWLPAGNYDLACYWFKLMDEVATSENPGDPLWRGVVICRGAQGNSIGGAPNGFNDYSPLPKQRYICSLVFNQRAFWFSEKDFRFSLQNNIYAYPLRNVVSSQTSKWRGAIQFSRLDQSTFQGSIIVFADNCTYSGWFSGNKEIATVRVSVDSVGPQPIDGSDFTLDYLSDSTAFSYRSACVAEGVAYWWGPQGVYKYEGMGKPVKISGNLEPDINDYVDMGRDDEVHCVYIKRCNEIVWFYPPKVTDTTYPTYGLAYNVESGNFYPYKFKFQVDSSQNLKIENDDTPDGVDGDRVLLHCRETASGTVQRTYFFDDIALAGDQGPASQLSVISFSTPVAGQRRLTLATGSAGITASGIVANDYISFQNVKGYAPGLTLAPDMIAKIVGVNNASNYIDILLPDGGDFDASGTLTGQTAFPIYHRGFNSVGLNGIPYLYQTNYWLADGLYQAWVWQYLYFLFKYAGIPQPKDPFHPLEGLLSRINLTFESTSGDAYTDILSLINNTKDHCQIHHPLYNEERSANGQALRFALSGIYIGDHWTFEYLEAHCMLEDGFIMKEYEG